MRKVVVTLLFIGVLFSCASDNKDSRKKPEVNTVNKSHKGLKSNLNISVLLDLSDRIDTVKYNNPSMQYYMRDVGYLKSIANSFASQVSTKKSRHLDDKIQIYFDPEPLNSDINTLSKELKFHVTRDNGTLEYLNNISPSYYSNGLKIYQHALADNNFVGSDTWGFFKHKVQDYCIDNDYRNILVIITDGYIFHEDSRLNENNMSSYLTPQTIRAKGLNNSNWKEKIESENFGFITIDQDLSKLEVLVLGINTNKINKYDDDILKKYWSDWLLSMGVEKDNFAFKDADLPTNMDIIINEFISN